MKLDSMSVEECFLGSATLGERGQIVIPAEARKVVDIHPGDKLLVFRHPIHPNLLILAKIGEMQMLLQQMAKTMEHIGNHLREESEAEEI